jgi:hypothetical protein
MDDLWPMLGRIAEQHGVDPLQDNWLKTHQVAEKAGLVLSAQSKRQGNDALDVAGQEHEIKTVNLCGKNSPGVTTHHHLTREVVANYRGRKWVVGVYDGVRLVQVYKLGPDDLEDYFVKWERELESRDHLNNPKIPLKHFRQLGTKIWEEGTNGT